MVGRGGLVWDDDRQLFLQGPNVQPCSSTFLTLSSPFLPTGLGAREVFEGQATGQRIGVHGQSRCCSRVAAGEPLASAQVSKVVASE
jgi:hypothetical protein